MSYACPVNILIKISETNLYASGAFNQSAFLLFAFKPPSFIAFYPMDYQLSATSYYL